MARAITRNSRSSTPPLRFEGIGFLILLSHPWTHPHQPSRPKRRLFADPPIFLALMDAWPTTKRFWSGPNYGRFLWNSYHHRGGVLPVLGILTHVPAALVDGLCACKRTKTFCCGDCCRPKMAAQRRVCFTRSICFGSSSGAVLDSKISH